MGICGLRGGLGKEKKGKFVNRKEASNRRDIYMVVLGCRTVRKELVITAIYKSLNGLVNQGISCSQSEATKPWHFRATLSLLERSVWLLGSGIGKIWPGLRVCGMSWITPQTF